LRLLWKCAFFLHSNVSKPFETFPLPEQQTKMVKIVMILDESGSMSSIKDNIRTSINEFIQKQQESSHEGDVDRFTLVKFSDIITLPYTINDQPLSEVKLLSSEDYKPSGGTALFDAIGRTIEHFQDQTNLLMVIVTDGEENASRTFKDRNAIQQLISSQKQDKQWSFVYLSTDIDTFRQGTNIGIQAAASSSTSSGSHNIAIGAQQLGSFLSNQCSNAVREFRTTGGKQGVAFH
jgi:uncharacterized protein YegL